ncbi:hypothetical protein LLE49_26305 [Alicyclobacillus tolerans]|uniref:hypothetical protein n=1 Tax=Alicyclobacillus tolerans TaxID=90970 RepID=UPI001F442BD8|nr:hypothetical protein [Alicyclobacillus tolerans]MCF8568239.1 hypothetical protein [Alicyclobacillus tolerans]
MPKYRKLRRQSVFSVRITNNVDDGFLKWLNQVHGRGLLQRMALEGLYLQYAQQLEVPGRWVPTPTQTWMDTPREALGYMVLHQERIEMTQPLESKDKIQTVSPNDEGDKVNDLSTESTDHSVENPALKSAFDFLNDD